MLGNCVGGGVRRGRSIGEGTSCAEAARCNAIIRGEGGSAEGECFGHDSDSNGGGRAERRASISGWCWRNSLGMKYGVSRGDDCVGWGVVTVMDEAVDEAEDEVA
jgi:hypothetical protein